MAGSKVIGSLHITALVDDDIDGASSRLLFKFCSGTHGLFEELGRHMNRGGSQECPNCGACKESVEHVLFECTSYDSQRQNFWSI